MWDYKCVRCYFNLTQYNVSLKNILKKTFISKLDQIKQSNRKMFIFNELLNHSARRDLQVVSIQIEKRKKRKYVQMSGLIYK